MIHRITNIKCRPRHADVDWSDFLPNPPFKQQYSIHGLMSYFQANKMGIEYLSQDSGDLQVYHDLKTNLSYLVPKILWAVHNSWQVFGSGSVLVKGDCYLNPEGFQWWAQANMSWPKNCLSSVPGDDPHLFVCHLLKKELIEFWFPELVAHRGECTRTCVDATGVALTVGREYQVGFLLDDMLLVVDDDGVQQAFLSERFTQ